MAPKPTSPRQFLDEDHQRIVEFGETYFDDEEERGAFVDTLMERRGYTRTSGWSLPAPQPSNGQGGGQPPAGGKSPYFKR